MSDTAYYYVQRACEKIGDCVLWWRFDDRGYSCNLLDAKKFTFEEARDAAKAGDTVWPKAYIDARAQLHVPFYHLNHRTEKELMPDMEKPGPGQEGS